MIDTLFLSGGGVKGFIYTGIFKFLEEKDLLKNIKNIISCSIGSFFAFCFSIKLNLSIIKKILLNINLYDIDDIDFNNFTEYGFFDNTIFIIAIKHILLYKYNVDKITLKELYDKTKINHKIKIYNYTKLKTEYYDHISNPDMDLALLITAATSIPLINKYVVYNNQYLLDGGITGSYPLIKDEKYNNYIGIFMYSNDDVNDENEENNFIDFIKFLLYKRDSQTSLEFLNYDKRIFKLGLNISSTCFKLSECDIENLINNGYINFKEYYNNNKDIFDNNLSTEEPPS